MKGSLNFIKKKSPIVIIEFSKYTLNSKEKVDFLDFFLKKYNYSIFDTNFKKYTLKEIMKNLSKLNKRFMTIGNYYLLKNSSKIFKTFLYE